MQSMTMRNPKRENVERAALSFRGRPVTCDNRSRTVRDGLALRQSDLAGGKAMFSDVESPPGAPKRAKPE